VIAALAILAVAKSVPVQAAEVELAAAAVSGGQFGVGRRRS